MIDLAFAGFALGPDPLSLVTFALAIFALGWALKEHGRAVAAAEAVSSAEARAAARVTQAELRLLLATQSESEVLDRLDSAVAVFGPDRKLQSFNIAFAERSRLVTAWLETRPLSVTFPSGVTLRLGSRRICHYLSPVQRRSTRLGIFPAATACACAVGRAGSAA